MQKYKMVNALAWTGALVLTALLVRNLPFASILASIVDLSIRQWLIWIIVNLLIIAVFVQRWSCLATGFDHDLGFVNLLLLRQAGQSSSFITPGPQFGGEPLQVYLLWRRFLLSPASSILLVTADRFYELWINFAVLLLGVLFLLFSESALLNLSSIAMILSILVIALSLLIWILIKRSEKIEKLIDNFAAKWLQSARLSEMKVQWENFNSSLKILLENTYSLSLALGLSIAGWLLTFVELYLVLGFFNISLNLEDLIMLMVMMRLAFLLPLPGGFGTLEAAVFWSFNHLHLPLAGAAAMLALIRTRDILMVAAGLYCLRLLQTKTVTV